MTPREMQNIQLALRLRPSPLSAARLRSRQFTTQHPHAHISTSAPKSAVQHAASRSSIQSTLMPNKCTNSNWRRPFSSTTTISSSSSSTGPITEKSRILEKPARFNPPSHGSRRVRPRAYPGPRLSEAELEQQKTKKYPNMMPPDGSFMYRFLTNRKLHLWITMSTLTTLALFAWFKSFLHTTIYRDDIPSWNDFFSHPFKSTRRFLAVYKLHVAHESEEVAQKRRRKLDDVQKRKEFLREHGVEPGFLTGSWMEKFGTVEGDEAKAKMVAKEKEAQQERDRDVDLASPQAVMGQTDVAGQGEGLGLEGQGGEWASRQEPKEKKKLKMWFGIW